MKKFSIFILFIITVFSLTSLISIKQVSAEPIVQCPVGYICVPVDTTTVTDASVKVNSSKLSLSYGAGKKESVLTATINFTVDGGTKGVNIYKNNVGFSLSNQLRRDANIPYTIELSAPSNIRTKTDSYSGTLYVIPSGTTATFTLKASANPKQMFAGTYYGSLISLYANNSSNKDNAFSLSVPENKTNAITIVGEISPYISSISNTGVVSPNDLITLNGVRFTGSTLLIDGAISNTSLTLSKNGKVAEFRLPNLSSGFHCFYLQNKDGLSNCISTEVENKGSTVSSSKPFIIKASARGFDWKVGSESTVMWSSNDLNSKYYPKIILVLSSATKNWNITKQSYHSSMGGYEGTGIVIPSSLPAGVYRMTLKEFDSTPDNLNDNKIVSDAVTVILKDFDTEVKDPIINDLRISHPLTSTVKSTSLVWDASFASNCVLNGPNFKVNSLYSTRESISTGILISNSTYTLTCKNTSGREVSKKITVLVPSTSPSPIIASPQVSPTVVSADIVYDPVIRNVAIHSGLNEITSNPILLTVGQKYLIKWNVNSIKTDTKFNIYIVSSTNTNQRYGSVNLSPLSYGVRSYEWTVPSSLADGADVRLSINSNDSIGYSRNIKIKNSNIGSVTDSVVNSPSPTPTSFGIQSITPSVGKSGTTVILKISGSTSEFVFGDFAFGTYNLDNFKVIDSQTISFTVPNNIPVGVYEVVWFSPNGDISIKDFTVTAPTASNKSFLGSVLDSFIEIFR